MDVVATPGGRKRGFDEQQSFDEAATPTPGPLKRRKLDDASSPSAPRAIGAAIASAISGVFGFSSQPNSKAGPHEPLKETSPNVNASAKPHLDDEQHPSSLNGGGLISQLKQPAAALTPPRPRPAIKLSALRGTKWDTGDLDLGPSPSPKKPAKPRGRTPKKDAATRRITATGPKAETEAKKKADEKDAEVRAEDGRETKTRRGRGAKNATDSTRGAGRGRGAGRARGTAGGAARGRGRRSAAEHVAAAADVVEPSDAEPEDEPANSPSQSKSLKRISSVIASTDHLDITADELSSTEVPDITPLKHRSFDLNTRLAASTEKSSPLPKSILSPIKKAGSQLKKSVSFNGGGGEVFFEDLPKSVSVNKKPKENPKPAEPIPETEPAAENESENENENEEDEEKSEDDDEITCAICSRPESEPPNEIILCDNCDFAAHQVCYEVPEIPEGDWLCKSCIQEDVLSGTPRKPTGSLSKADTVSAAEEIPNIPNLDHHLRALQRILLDRCAGRRRIRMFGQDDAYEKTQQLVEQTVNAGEGNSMLLIGPRGCGKTTMLENIVSDLSRQHGRDFYVVRLNGFIHTDDKLALKEIWRQLGKEMNVEDDLLNRSNYADTMASLLALLSHPSEILGVDEGVTSQSVVFIIDEFDMFAAHPRQTLLYNLFDIAQSRKAPIAVLGCTTRLDVVEMLEKRVKSRFSHRYVYLSLPRSLPAYWQICRQGLMVGEEEDAEDAGLDVRMEGHVEFHKYWNQKITGLYNQQAFQDLLQYHFYTTKAPSAFFNEWILPLSTLSATHLDLSVPTTTTTTTTTAGSDSTSLTPPDSRTQLLSTLSDLELGLVIAGARLDIIADTDTVNFAMVYDEYSTLVGRQRAQSATSGLLAVGGSARVWSRGVAGIAWERLITLGLLVASGVGGSSSGSSSSRSLGHGGLDGKMWRVDVALEEIPASTKLSSVLAKWCKEI